LDFRANATSQLSKADCSQSTEKPRDTYVGTLQTPFSLNRYTYGLNNPLRYSDPTGHYAEHASCYRDDRSYDWDCDHAANDDGHGVETDHPLCENADGTPKSSGYSVPAPRELLGPAATPEQLTQPNNGPSPTSNAAAGATASSGNLTYTPRALTEEEILTLFRQGNTSNAIADSWTDARYIYRMSAAGTAGKVAAGSQVVAAAGAATCVETVGAGCVVAAGAEVIALGAETVVVVSSLWDLINGASKIEGKSEEHRNEAESR
jgi:hypothetical protein